MNRFLLYPFSILWSGVLYLRNRFYDYGLLSSKQFDFPLIIVGNLTLGGTGKTPFVQHLAKLLAIQQGLFLLSRGYGRKTKGLLEVLKSGTADDFGDEALLNKVKYPHLKVFVAEQRVPAIKKISGNLDKPIALLDDAYQHRALKPGFSILLFNEQELGQLQMVPYGRLRDNFYRIKDADLVVLTKCRRKPDEGSIEQLRKFFRLREGQELFCTGLSYAAPRHIFSGDEESVKSDHFILLTGIASPEPLLNSLSAKGNLLKHFRFRDHHSFSNDDLKSIKEYFDNIADANVVIYTTEKDAVRLISHKYADIIRELPIYAVPVCIDFFEKEEEDKLNNKILNYVRSHS